MRRREQKKYDLVCIGSGPAGQRAAIQASKLGHKVAVIEKRQCVGGVCIDTGTIPSKTFREAVRRYYSRPSLNASGRPVRAPRPELQELVSHVSSVIEREGDIVQDALARNDVDVLRGHAKLTGPNSITIESFDGAIEIETDFILIAVGTTPAKPPNVKSEGGTIITSDEILDITNIPRSMTVVGAGVIGIEYASMFAALGVNVTVVDKRPRPLEFLDGEIVDELIHQMRKADVTFRCGEAVESMHVVETPRKQGLIELESGKHIVSDVILFSAGRVGATDSLGLAEAGLSVDNRGRITVNHEYQTEVPNIYAAGDVIGYPALAATSSEQGRLAACHMFGAAATKMGDHFPIGIYAIPEISMVGKTEEELTRNQIPYETGVASYKEIARGQILGDESGMFKMIFHRDDRSLLGVHCIGTGATELIHVGQAVIGLGGGLDYFLNTVFNYPTLAECYKVAAFNAANKMALVQSAVRSRTNNGG